MDNQGSKQADMIRKNVRANLAELERHCLRSPIYAWSNQLTKLEYTPPIMYISATNLCSHHCEICPHKTLMRKGKYPSGQRRQGIISRKRLRDIADAIPEGVARIYFYKQGEPLLHPHYMEMAQYLREKVGDQVELAISTNASHLWLHLAQPLIDTLDVIVFSLYALERESFTRLHGKDNFEKVMKHLKSFHDVYVRTPSPRAKIYLNFVRQDGNRQYHQEEVEKFFQQHFPAFNHALHGVFNWGGEIPQGNYSILCREDKSDYPVCIFPYTASVVLWDGWVAPCIVDIREEDHNGRIPEMPLNEVVNHPGLVDFRKAFVARDFSALTKRGHFCARCNWLFQLRAQSLNYLSLYTKKIAEKYEIDDESMQLSADDHMLTDGGVLANEHVMAGTKIIANLHIHINRTAGSYDAVIGKPCALVIEFINKAVMITDIHQVASGGITQDHVFKDEAFCTHTARPIGHDCVMNHRVFANSVKHKSPLFLAYTIKWKYWTIYRYVILSD